MEDMPTMYKRRVRTPLSELKWNDLDSRQNFEDQASTSSSDDDASEDTSVKGKAYNLRSGSKKPRLLNTSRRGRKRSNGQKQNRTGAQTPAKFPAKSPAKTLKKTPTGTPRKSPTVTPTKTPTGKNHPTARGGDENTPDQQIPDTPLSEKPEWMLTPEEFVTEKRAMFAAIDDFELESEEESDGERADRKISNRQPARKASSIARSFEDVSSEQIESLHSKSAGRIAADQDSGQAVGTEEAEDMMDISSPGNAGDESTNLQSKMPEPRKDRDAGTTSTSSEEEEIGRTEPVATSSEEEASGRTEPVAASTEEEANGPTDPVGQRETDAGITVIDLGEEDPEWLTSDAHVSNAVITIDSGSDSSPRAPARNAKNSITLDSDDDEPDSVGRFGAGDRCAKNSITLDSDDDVPDSVVVRSEAGDTMITSFGNIGLSSSSNGGGLVQTTQLEEQVEVVTTRADRHQETVTGTDVSQEPPARRLDKGKAIIVEPDEEIPESSRAGARRNRRWR